MEEKWADVPNYEGLYKVSNFGQIYSVRKHRILKPLNTHHGYKRIRLYTDSQHWGVFAIHRLVAQAFVPNPLNLPEINHKDENHSNNYFDNLEWCDRKYNVNYGKRTEKTYCPVVIMDEDDNIVKIFDSQVHAMIETKIRQGSISNCCRGFSKTAGSCKWRYKNDR